MPAAFFPALHDLRSKASLRSILVASTSFDESSIIGAMGTTTRKQREVRQREQMLLDAARRLLVEHGYAGLTMERVVQAAIDQGDLTLRPPATAGSVAYAIFAMVIGADIAVLNPDLIRHLEVRANRGSVPAKPPSRAVPQAGAR